MDWVCLLLDAHFTVLVMTPEAKGLLLNLHSFVKSQVTTSLNFSLLPQLSGRLLLLKGYLRKVSSCVLRLDWCLSLERSRAAFKSLIR